MSESASPASLRFRMCFRVRCLNDYRTYVIKAMSRCCYPYSHKINIQKEQL